MPRLRLRARRSRIPTIQALIVIFVLLFILFLWLNFALAQRTESVGREIQVKTQELESLERRGDALRKAISVEASQERMAARAHVLGYQPQAPFFLPMSEPLLETVSEAPAPVEQIATLSSSGNAATPAANKLLLLLRGPIVGPAFETAP
jgi:cell division protein FtsB